MRQHMEQEGVTAGAVAIATMLALLIWGPPQVHRKISAVGTVPASTPRGATRQGMALAFV